MRVELIRLGGHWGDDHVTGVTEALQLFPCDGRRDVDSIDPPIDVRELKEVRLSVACEEFGASKSGSCCQSDGKANGFALEVEPGHTAVGSKRLALSHVDQRGDDTVGHRFASFWYKGGRAVPGNIIPHEAFEAKVDGFERYDVQLVSA
jgi:hypothetical protein